tara:strand:+ start:71 stop:253 length:183 start_codon:yes stop_codon:yes gene_type:complete
MSKLRKSSDRMIFGVCGGIANSIGIDPAIVRIGFVVGALCSVSILFWIYLLMAIVLPKAE